ncbi:hypothetical protein [Actinoplanes rectilineatus]|uniref:hypothetical protein n=1 Tax=Actinoplanes rectilineatus TaxID=113571 RepID=UPI0005F2DEDE|nr:hypothetical protein [Actinoplanes rectilineatus]
MDRIRACIFVPPRLSLDGLYAQRCMTYVARRGYALVSLLRDWGTVERSLLAGHSQVVVVARQDHYAGGCQPGRGVEVVTGERTRVIRRQVVAGSCRVRAAAPAAALVAAYRSGYADGYVDCLTIRSEGVGRPD